MLVFIAARNTSLNIGGALYGVSRTDEARQDPVARMLYLPPLGLRQCPSHDLIVDSGDPASHATWDFRNGVGMSFFGALALLCLFPHAARAAWPCRSWESSSIAGSSVKRSDRVLQDNRLGGRQFRDRRVPYMSNLRCHMSRS
jgi:hypothetical protein